MELPEPWSRGGAIERLEIETPGTTRWSLGFSGETGSRNRAEGTIRCGARIELFEFGPPNGPAGMRDPVPGLEVYFVKGTPFPLPVARGSPKSTKSHCRQIPRRHPDRVFFPLVILLR